MVKTLIDQGLLFIKSGSRVFLHGCAGTPKYLSRLLANRASELQRVELISILPLDNSFSDPKLKDSFFHNSLFASAFVRPCIANGTASYIPTLLSEMPRLFDENILPLDAVLIQVSPPDKHGYCSLGVSVEATRSAVRNAKKIIAQINRRMPRVHGDTFVHMNKIDAYVEYDEPLIELDYSQEITEAERTIGKKVAELIDDKSTLQMGIGAIPDTVLKCLENHKDLSIASEMISDGVMTLIQKGVVTNRYKNFHPGTTTCTFILGTRKLYDFVHDNPSVLSLDVGITNDPAQIRQNYKMCAINSALEIDLTGQVCADSLGSMHYSGVGGQMDFMRGAALCQYGKPILVLPSQTSKGVSRIVSTLKEGAGVTTTRAHVHYVVTEYGIANLFGKNYQQRAKALISLAHPDHREVLERAAYQRCAGTPQHLNRLLANRADELRRVEIMSILPLDDTFSNPKLKDSFFHNSLFASAFVRPCIANGTASYIPTLLSEMPRLFDENILPLDAVLIQVSPSDKHGYCSLGVSVEATKSAVRNAKKIIAQINRHMPRVHGDTFVHMNKIDAYVEYDEPLIKLGYSNEITDVERTIEKKVAELIDDKSTTQIRQNYKMCAINSALEIDLTGQVCADSLGSMHYSGVGGQMDFMRGAALCQYGKPILVYHDKHQKECHLKEGAGVTTTRVHVHYVVIEYGVANLFGKNYQERAKVLISLAHPDHREVLERAAYQRFKNIY